MAQPGATHQAAAPSHTPATRERTGRLHRDVHGRPTACRNPGLLDDPELASVYHPRFRDRNFAIRVIERERGVRLTAEEVMALFGCNRNVATQSRDRRWEAEMEAQGW
jgi:hypothetical protein